MSRGSYKPFLHHVTKGRPIPVRPVKLRVPRRAPRTLEPGQIVAILAACEHLRDRFLLSLLAETGGLGVQPQGQRVQLRISPAVAAASLICVSRVSGSARRVVGRRRGFGHLLRRVVRLVNEPGVHRALVQAAQRGHQVLLRAAPAAGVAPGHHVGLDVAHQLPDLRRGGRNQAAAAPVLDDPVPVRAIRPAGPGADRRRHDRDVLGEGRHLRAGLRGGQVRRGQAHPLQQHQCRLHHSLSARRFGAGILRRTPGLSKADVAKRAGVSVRTVERVMSETGKAA